MIRWDADTDRNLLIAIMDGVPVHLSPDAVERVSQAFPSDPVTGERPTAKAITERIYRMKTMMRKFGTAEPRRNKKKPEQIKATQATSAAVKSRKARTTKVSTDKVTKPKASKTKRSKSKATSDDTSDDDEDYEPVKPRCTREARALVKENPDFRRYGKEASPSRKRASKVVRYNETEAIKGEPQSEEESGPTEAVSGSLDTVFHQPPESTPPTAPDTSTTNVQSNGIAEGTSYGHQTTPMSAQCNSGLGAPLCTPITPTYPSYSPYDSQPLGVSSMASHQHTTSDSSFASSDYSTNRFRALPSRHDSVIDSHEFGNYMPLGLAYPSLNMGLIQHSLGGQTSPTTPITTATIDQFPLTPPATVQSKNSRSQLGGLRRAMTWNSSLPNNMSMMPVAPDNMSVHPSSPAMSAGNTIPCNILSPTVMSNTPILQRSVTDSNLDVMLNHGDMNGEEQFNPPGLGIDMNGGFDGSILDTDQGF